ncbi:GNAT family N-acetyltransferase [Pseudoroseicyclus tamaricis]|uniref:GNAT family N-acetyltransferase n=1 Tax=Pseudoroseicyclus tamaricis TaxID=2705421 RepID=A0A6B2K266_9RHOB|nr:GNAT family N-acetyltransferase [Pseudoroseicyclus tamaricis]NDV02624.1 GNAT family N-acetyltransferase [Pseudoroseicyclus tamaricis]
MSVTARPYRPEDTAGWNAFVAASRNGTFLFDRGYMDYHADRFTDASLVIEKDGRTLALLPANRDGEALVSHGGLTYGGLVTAPEAGLTDVLAALEAVALAGREAGLSRLVYKCVPAIYHRAPAEEDLWALHRLGARLIRRDALAVVGPDGPPPARARAKDLRKAGRQEGLAIGPSTDWAGFWEVLGQRLRAAEVVAGAAGSQLLQAQLFGRAGQRSLILHNPELEETPALTAVQEALGQRVLVLPGTPDPAAPGLPYNRPLHFAPDRLAAALEELA